MKKPETYAPVVFGNMDPEVDKQFVRRQRIGQVLIPPLLFINRKYNKNKEKYHKEALRETTEKILKRLEAQGLKSGQTANLHLKGTKLHSATRSREYGNDTDAYVRFEDIPDSKAKKGAWAIHIPDAVTGTSTLLHLQTEHSSDAPAHISKLEVVDPISGSAYTPKDYGLQDRAGLYETAQTTLDEIEFNMYHGANLTTYIEGAETSHRG